MTSTKTVNCSAVDKAMSRWRLQPHVEPKRMAHLSQEVVMLQQTFLDDEL
jgi:hypothetical protein